VSAHAAGLPRWEHYPHEADIGVRGIGATREEAFEQAALALTAVVTDPAGVSPGEALAIGCEAPDDELLLLDWLDALVFAMATMRVPGVIFASRDLLEAMDDKVAEQVANVASLPGIVTASYTMPDAHWGYGFPIGGVAAFDADDGGVVSAGGVGFDISCGVRTLHTGLKLADVEERKARLADVLFARIPAGIGSTGGIRLDAREMEAMLNGGARWAVQVGYGSPADLEHIEEHGRVAGADPACVSELARKRQRDEMGTLGSGNHYLEVQVVSEIFDAAAAHAYGLAVGDIVVSIHCGSRGLGHQVGTDYLREMVVAAPAAGIALPDRELACAPIGPRSASAISAPCAPPSTARWPTGRSLPPGARGLRRGISRRQAGAAS
jgi:RNA-splicing ligase RtcB